MQGTSSILLCAFFVNGGVNLGHWGGVKPGEVIPRHASRRLDEGKGVFQKCGDLVGVFLNGGQRGRINRIDSAGDGYCLPDLQNSIAKSSVGRFGMC